jgi:hypothetical protein
MSVKNMSWFARDETQTAKEGAVLEVKDVDLVAKLLCDATFIVDETIYHKLAFADDDKNLYFAEYAGRFDNVAEGDVVKLRSISMYSSRLTAASSPWRAGRSSSAATPTYCCSRRPPTTSSTSRRRPRTFPTTRKI